MPLRQSLLLIDLAFGDSGKGTIIDFLARHTAAHTVVRFNGGPQAAHNVVTPDGRHHTFAQFGSATFIPGVRTLLSRFMLVEPYALFNEAQHLHALGVPDALDRLTIDARCPIITPAHQAANRLVELARGDFAHGTCGLGIGQTMQDLLDHPELMIHARDLADRAAVTKKLHALRDLKHSQLAPMLPALKSLRRAQFGLQTLGDPSWIDVAIDNYAHLAREVTIADKQTVTQILNEDGTTLFEGAQGVLLDEWHGFHPHTTWSTTTFANAQTLLAEARYAGDQIRLGVLRTYFTRHGPGPFVTEDPTLRAALPEPHNADDGWQGRFRVGHFDAVAARYALEVVGGVDGLALTHIDRLPNLPGQMCTAYECGKVDLRGLPVSHTHELWQMEKLTRLVQSSRPEYRQVAPDTFVETLQTELKSTVSILSAGPTAADKKVLWSPWSC